MNDFTPHDTTNGDEGQRIGRTRNDVMGLKDNKPFNIKSNFTKENKLWDMKSGSHEGAHQAVEQENRF